MTKYPCPVCGKRACDSDKRLKLERLSGATCADLAIKCQNCKNALAVYVEDPTPEPLTSTPKRLFYQ